MERLYLEQIKNKLFYEYKYANKYKKKRLTYDMNGFNSLVEKFGYDDLLIDIPFINDKGAIAYKVCNYLFDFESLCDEVIKMFKEIKFFFAEDMGYSKLSKKDQEDILKEFLLGFCPEAYHIYEELVKVKRVFNYVEESKAGEAIILSEIDQYFLGINENELDNDLANMETIIHELMHIYTEYYLKKFGFNATCNSAEGFYMDTIPMYSEIEFYNFLINNRIYVDSMHKHANYNDRIRISFYKEVKYLAEMAKREDTRIVITQSEYSVYGNTKLATDSDNPIYRYPEYYDTGNLNSFIYVMSLLDAYKLEEAKSNGEKNVINRYLTTLQDPGKLEKDLDNGYDLSCMRSDIKRHCDEILKIYQRK